MLVSPSTEACGRFRTPYFQRYLQTMPVCRYMKRSKYTLPQNTWGHGSCRFLHEIHHAPKCKTLSKALQAKLEPDNIYVPSYSTLASQKHLNDTTATTTRYIPLFLKMNQTDFRISQYSSREHQNNNNISR